jgi:hypothetical protein
MTAKQTNPNMGLWERVCVTDPKAVKPITGKQYNGNSPKPYWIVQRLTEEFGPCGKGWGFSILNERMERLTENDVLHVAVVRFWYVSEGARCELEQIGQTKAVYKTSKGALLVDEDAPKKSVTDALVKCASYIGFAGDIFSGRWDDSKYVAWAREQYAEELGEDKSQRDLSKGGTYKQGARDGIGDDLPDEDKQYLSELAHWVAKQVSAGAQVKAAQHIAGENLEADQRVYLENQLDSKTRSAIKKAESEIRETFNAKTEKVAA